MRLSLRRIQDVFPEHWSFVPNALNDYIPPVRRELEALGVFGDTPAAERHFAGFATVPRYFHPRADREALVVSLELISWYFYFDDPFDDGEVRDEGAALVRRMVAVLIEGELPAQPTPTEQLAWRFRERARRMAGVRGAAAWQRFVTRLAAWVESIIPLNRRLADEPVRSLAEYDAVRTVNVGITPEYALNEIVAGLELDDAFIAHPAVRRHGELAALVIAYCNDIYSYEREARQATQLNSLELRARLGGLSLAEAFEAQLADIERMTGEMVAIERALHAERVIGLSSVLEPAEVATRRRDQTRYLEDVAAIVVGNHAWSLAGGRYHSPSSPFAELRGERPAAAPPLAGWWSSTL